MRTNFWVYWRRARARHGSAYDRLYHPILVESNQREVPTHQECMDALIAQVASSGLHVLAENLPVEVFMENPEVGYRFVLKMPDPEPVIEVEGLPG